MGLINILEFKNGLCHPASCSEKDLSENINALLDPISKDFKLKVSVVLSQTEESVSVESQAGTETVVYL